ncbi:potassium channel family protein [Vibrio alginolyticus]|nr:two pore domain potassium channel family protein [Vibrio alginolyticus]
MKLYVKGQQRQRLVPPLGYQYERFSVGHGTLPKSQVICISILGNLQHFVSRKVKPGANLQNAGDVFSWTFVTITTVGYGDFFPVVTLQSRIVAIILITTGVGMFGRFAEVLVSWIVGASNKRKMEVQILEEFEELRFEIQELKELPKVVIIGKL